jgi:hypothetical protein
MDWLQHRSSAEQFRFVEEVSQALASRGPLSASFNELVARKRFKDLVDKKIDYMEEFSVDDLRGARQIQALFSKQEQDWFGYGANMEQVAENNFMNAEGRCRVTNLRLNSTRPSGRVSVVSHYAARKISAILGEVPSLDVLKFSFGPGATTNVKSAVANAQAKLSARPICSEDMLPCVGEFLAEFPYLAEHHCTKGVDYVPFYLTDPPDLRRFVEVQVGHGKLTFVPKSVKTKRPIVVEPILNGLAQKGIGDYIKGRLLRVANLDLKDQERNRRLAKLASVNDELATIDLSNASDTVSLSVVFELLPPGWVDFLGQFRTGTVIHRNRIIELEKWSSMGNAYTFELESLLFYSLAWACCVVEGCEVENVSVFGDDIILSSEATPLLMEVLDWYGFEVNTDKSYCSGPFRESCGTDWFRGIDIRPFYLKERISDQNLYVFHNWAMRNCELNLARVVHEWTFPPNRLYGPHGYGDGHLIGSYTLYNKRRSRRRGYSGGYFDTYAPGIRRLERRLPADWLLPTYSVYTRSGLENPTDPYVVRGTKGYRRLSVYTLATTIFRG